MYLERSLATGNTIAEDSFPNDEFLPDVNNIFSEMVDDLKTDASEPAAFYVTLSLFSRSCLSCLFYIIF
jgi:hypothetical protein